jgi:integrase
VAAPHVHRDPRPDVRTLAIILRAAVDADLIKRSPCYRAGLPRYDTDEMRLLTIGEIVALADAIHPRYKALVLLAGTGGLRIGELGALRGRRVDLRRGTVEVVDNLALDNGTPVIGPVKTKASRRRIPLPRQTVTALGDHLDEFGVGPDDFVFTSAQGHLLRAYQFRRRYFHPAVASVGLGPLRPHDLRHSAISLWIASGANPKVVQVKAGHSSIKITYDRYGHLFPDYDDRTTRHLEQLWAEAETDNVVPLARPAPS